MPRRNSNGRLEDAIALLVNTQAQFVAQLARSDQRVAWTDERFARNDELFLEGKERFARIMQLFAEIKAILSRREQLLLSLPEAVGQKLGLEPR